MKNFTDLLDTIDLIEEGTRDRAKGFKAKMRPLIKKMKTAQIGDARRYAYQLLWPFMRDELQIAELQGQDTPINSAVIQRTLEDLSDAGKIPDDAGDQFETYANEQFDSFVDQVSATKRKTSHKSHYRGQDVKKHVDIAGGGTGFTDEESASERAKRIEQEQKLKKEIQAKGPEDVRAEFQSALDNIADRLGPEKGKGVPQFGETYTKQDTYLIEIVFDEPVVQKQAALDMFPEDELASPIERSQQGFDVELKPDSAIAQRIQQSGVDSVETFLADLIGNKLGVSVKVNIMEPETEDPAKPLIDVYKNPHGDVSEDEEGWEEKGWRDEQDRQAGAKKHARQRNFEDERTRTKTKKKTKGWIGRDTFEDEEDAEGPEASTEIELPQGMVTVFFKNGVVVQVDAPEGLDINVGAVNNNLKKGWQLRDALISARNTRPGRSAPEEVPSRGGFGGYGRRRFSDFNDSVDVSDYMPASDGDPDDEPVVLEMTKDRFKPKTHHQMDEYRRLMGG